MSIGETDECLRPVASSLVVRTLIADSLGSILDPRRRIKPKALNIGNYYFSAKCLALKMKVTGVSDMIFKTEFLYHGMLWHDKKDFHRYNLQPHE